MFLNETKDWGYYVVQSQECPKDGVTVVTYELGCYTPPPDSSVNIDIPLDTAMQITGISGNLSITGYGEKTNASIVAVIYAMGPNGDTPISWVKAAQLGKGSLIVPVNTIFPFAIKANNLKLGWFIDLPEAQTVSAALIITYKPITNIKSKK
jgi:hypothetical protein